jgi:predicted dehydrogenase
MFTNRESGRFRAAKQLHAEGAIGKLQTIAFSGQHPLLYGTRPSWYFEAGKHGGTWNDIGIHAFDAIPWIFGTRWRRVVAARVWNTRLHDVPQFQVGAQAMLELEDGSGVLGDVSYLAPDSQGYTVPQYWRYTVHGTAGIMETGTNFDAIRIFRDGARDGQTVEPDPDRPYGSVEDFLHEAEGQSERCELTGDTVIESSRVALTVQAAAEYDEFPRGLGADW